MIDIFIKYAPTIATLFFFITFCYIVFITLKKSNKKKFDEYSQMPLKDKLEDESSQKNDLKNDK